MGRSSVWDKGTRDTLGPQEGLQPKVASTAGNTIPPKEQEGKKSGGALGRAHATPVIQRQAGEVEKMLPGSEGNPGWKGGSHRREGSAKPGPREAQDDRDCGAGSASAVRRLRDKEQVGEGMGTLKTPAELRGKCARHVSVHPSSTLSTDHPVPPLSLHTSYPSWPPAEAQASWHQPEHSLLTSRSSVTRLSMGTWPRSPWRSPFGITTLENPTILLVRGQSGSTVSLCACPGSGHSPSFLVRGGSWSHGPPAPRPEGPQTFSSLSAVPQEETGPEREGVLGGSHSTVWWSTDKRR